MLELYTGREPEVELPDKLSELIKLAVSDARKLDKLVYIPEYASWHRPHDGLCSVCFAGVVMAGTLGCSPKKIKYQYSFSPDTELKLGVLERCRRGDWCGAVEELGLPIEDRLHHLFNSREFDRNPDSCFVSWSEFDRFLNGMLVRADKLAEAGY